MRGLWYAHSRYHTDYTHYCAPAQYWWNVQLVQLLAAPVGGQGSGAS